MIKKRWYYLDDGREYGPYRLEQLKSLAQTQVIGYQSLVWSENLPDWKPLIDVLSHREYISASSSLASSMREKPPEVPVTEEKSQQWDEDNFQAFAAILIAIFTLLILIVYQESVWNSIADSSTTLPPVTEKKFSYVQSENHLSSSAQEVTSSEIEVRDSGSKSNDGFTLYESIIYNFSVEYPSDWVKRESAQQRIRLSVGHPETATNFNVIVTHNPKFSRIDPGKYVRILDDNPGLYMDKVRQVLPGARRLTSGIMKLDGRKAFFVVYDASLIRKQRLIQVMTVLKNGYSYILTFGTSPKQFEEKFSLFRDILDSFQIHE